MSGYFPEGFLIDTPENVNSIRTPEKLIESMKKKKILEAKVIVCDSQHNLIVDLGGMKGVIPRIEGAVGIEDGTARDVALISRVNKPVQFKILRIENDVAILSRRIVQEECQKNFIDKFMPGDIVPAVVTRLDKFGAFVDIGAGVISLVPIDAISISRINHPTDRFKVGQQIRVIIKGEDDGKILLSHKELLGTWEENAAGFEQGETVAGIIRSVESYGIFIELTPNLAGLAEPRDDVYEGQFTSVYIKALLPEKMKVKLIIIDVWDDAMCPTDIKYFYKGDRIDEWEYAPAASSKSNLVVFR
ncbi:MAG: S1 RNA-binding domain-containing protein [Ruminococcus sp.]|jgi:small subunit ribosomal protein S1|nr:S1 RNA-binding domain-containing protein [Ruminococcus sp.]